MGWEDGKGLGKNLDGLHEPIQVKRRDLGTGLGQEDEPTENKAKNFKWNDNFWDDAYNKTASKMTSIGGKKLIAESDSSSSDYDSGKDSDSSTTSSFKITIVKAPVSYLSKKIKKDKSEKKDKKKKKDKK